MSFDHGELSSSDRSLTTNRKGHVSRNYCSTTNLTHQLQTTARNYAAGVVYFCCIEKRFLMCGLKVENRKDFALQNERRKKALACIFERSQNDGSEKRNVDTSTVDLSHF